MCPSAGENECQWLLAGNNGDKRQRLAQVGSSLQRGWCVGVAHGCGWMWIMHPSCTVFMACEVVDICICHCVPTWCNLATSYMQYTCLWLHCGMLCTGDSAVVLSTTCSTYIHMPYCWSMLRVETVFLSCRLCSFTIGCISLVGMATNIARPNLV